MYKEEPLQKTGWFENFLGWVDQSRLILYGTWRSALIVPVPQKQNYILKFETENLSFAQLGGVLHNLALGDDTSLKTFCCSLKLNLTSFDLILMDMKRLILLYGGRWLFT